VQAVWLSNNCITVHKAHAIQRLKRMNKKKQLGAASCTLQEKNHASLFTEQFFLISAVN